MKEEKRFCIVVSDLWHTPLPNHLEQGYETERDFRRALRLLVERWHGRTGEAVGERHGFTLLRFHDTPGSVPDEAWLPDYLLRQTDDPGYEDDTSESMSELNSAFGFD